MKAGICQPSASVVNTGTPNVQGANTTTVYTDPTAPIYFLIGNAGICPRHAPLDDSLHTLAGTNVVSLLALCNA